MSDKTFGETIRALRESKGLLLRQVAAALEIDTALISKIERGERTAQREQVSKLAAMLEIEEERLMVIWLSDKIMNIVEEEPAAYKALKKTEKRITKN
ncbi:MAG: helix-turn-helix transcriptional regulator [Bacteroidetes bacterium]|nr:helix-turn-helix transcriptional regulator [Bacteroidota bacterium]